LPLAVTLVCISSLILYLPASCDSLLGTLLLSSFFLFLPISFNLSVFLFLPSPSPCMQLPLPQRYGCAGMVWYLSFLLPLCRFFFSSPLLMLNLLLHFHLHKFCIATADTHVAISLFDFASTLTPWPRVICLSTRQPQRTLPSWWAVVLNAPVCCGARAVMFCSMTSSCSILVVTP
jgi:hypothetical protein